MKEIFYTTLVWGFIAVMAIVFIKLGMALAEQLELFIWLMMH